MRGLCFLLPSLLVLGCAPAADPCARAVAHIAECLDQRCGGSPDDPLCAQRQPSAVVSCNATRADEAAGVAAESCDELLRQAAVAGKGDSACPWYFPWCAQVAPEHAGYSVHVIEASGDHLTMQVDVDQLMRTQGYVGTDRYQSLSIDGAGTLGERGKPDLPTIGLLVGVPWDTISLTVEATALRTEPVEGPLPPPFRGLDSDTGSPRPWIKDLAAYGDAAVYPAASVTLDSPGVWRDFRVARLQVRPVRVVAAQQSVSLDRSLRVTVHFDRQTGTDGPSHTSEGSPPYGAGLANFGAGATARPGADGPSLDYLVVVADELAPALQPWVSYRTGLGQTVRTLALSSLVADTETDSTKRAAAIKKAIADSYAAEHPVRVMLVGATNRIPMYHYAGEDDTTIPSDAWYSFLDGDDLLADVALGRLPAHNDAELSLLVDKTLAFEQGSLAEAWRSRFVMAAHKEDAPEKYTACVNSIVHGDWGRPVAFDTFLGMNRGSNSSLTTAIDDGAEIVNYRGHGDIGYWWHWGADDQDYYASSEKLSNGTRTPVVLSVACLTADLESKASLAEQFLMQRDGGAVVFLGATQPSATVPNHLFDQSMWRALLSRNVHEVGQLLDAGNVALVKQWQSDNYAMDNVRMYLVAGDPGVRVGRSYHCDAAAADAGPDLDLPPGGSAQLGAAEVPGYRYEWSPVSGLSCTTCARPTAAPNKTTTYTVKVRTPCNITTDTVNVRLP